MTQDTVVVRKAVPHENAYGIRAVDLATILTEISKVAARHTPFDFRSGYAGDMLHDAVQLYHLEPGETLWWLVRDMGTHTFDSLPKAREIQSKNFPKAKLFKLTRGKDGSGMPVKFDGVST